MVITCESRYATRAQDSFPSRIAVCCSIILLPPNTITANHFAPCGDPREVSPITSLSLEGLVEWCQRTEHHDEQPLLASPCAVAGGRRVPPVHASAGPVVGHSLQIGRASCRE